MTDIAAAPDGREVAFESFGVPVGVTTNDPAVEPALDALVPPHATLCPAESVKHRFAVRRKESGLYDVRYNLRDGKPAGEMDPLSWVASDVERRFALAMADAYVHNTVALHAPEHVFVQGGVVAGSGSAIILLGKPLTGRTTLVEALVATGLTYVSDEYAVLDADGQVSRYARPLPSGADSDGGPDEPLPVAAVVITGYRPGAEWQPVGRSSGEGLLAMMAHVVGGQERPEQTMRSLKAVIEREPVIFETARGEAADAAAALMSQVQGAPSA